MNNPSENRSTENAHVRTLVEQYGAREIFRSFAAGILLGESTRELHPSLRNEMEPRKIIINEQALRELRTRPREPIKLPSQEEALYWLRRWRERKGQNPTH